MPEFENLCDEFAFEQELLDELQDWSWPTTVRCHRVSTLLRGEVVA